MLLQPAKSFHHSFRSDNPSRVDTLGLHPAVVIEARRELVGETLKLLHESFYRKSVQQPADRRERRPWDSGEVTERVPGAFLCPFQTLDTLLEGSREGYSLVHPRPEGCRWKFAKQK